MIGENVVSVYQSEHWVASIGHAELPIGWICGMYTEDLLSTIPAKFGSNVQSTVEDRFVRVAYQKQQLPIPALF